MASTNASATEVERRLFVGVVIMVPPWMVERHVSPVVSRANEPPPTYVRPSSESAGLRDFGIAVREKSMTESERPSANPDGGKRPTSTRLAS
jgi:hypothetical protein